MGSLRRSMYGTRDAPQIWSSEVKRVMEGMGFIACAANPCVFHHPGWDTLALAHVDDFLVVGGSTALEAVKCGITREFEAKAKTLGPGDGEYREVEFLGASFPGRSRAYLMRRTSSTSGRSSRNGTCWSASR